MDEETIVQEAINGSLDAQKSLLLLCQTTSRTLTYKYLRSLFSVGLNIDDAKECINYAFAKTFRKYDANKGKFTDYFNYVLMMEIKSCLRTYRRGCKNDNRMIKVNSIDDNNDLQFQSPYYQNKSSINAEIEEAEIRNLVLEKKVVPLTNKEFKIMEMYFKGFNLKEMSDSLERNYTETCRCLKRAMNKIKKYFQK